MSETDVITLRIPWELKRRIEKKVKFQGGSLNQFSNYSRKEHLTQLELISSLEFRLAE